VGMQVVMLPVIAKIQATGDQARMRAVLIQVERWTSFLLWPFVVVVVVFPSAVIHITLSDAFLPASAALVLLSLQSVLVSLRLPLQTKALGSGDDKFAARVAVWTLIVAVGAALILVPPQMLGMGADGAAWAALLSAAVPFILYRREAREWTGHPWISKHVRRHLMAAAMVGAGIFWVSTVWAPARFYSLIGVGLAATLVYTALLYMVQEVTWRDLAALWRREMPK